ncbi:MAG: CotH kinase family protein [Butyrivibrio sp.]|nr:CotH kinase family protein [Butyrivibrio sp.]
MTTNKNIDRICIIITIIAVLVTGLFLKQDSMELTAQAASSLGYEEKIFDSSYVHSIDISIDDWDAFLETAESEKYTAVDVTIDGETIKNVGLRAKGNTSLSTVSQLDSDRYSLKIEFDSYQDSNTYYGLDKLCLNNLIQDYTMMKDYLTYTLMNEFGANAPLVSYTYVTVNGEDWGLFLAVEAVEDSFLERNYGSDYGDLYKPDTMSMGGGRGNGGDFDMRNADFEKMGIKNPFEQDGDSEESGDESSGDSSSGDESSDKNSSGKDSFGKDSKGGMPQPPSGNFPGGNDGPGGNFPGGGFPGGDSDSENSEMPDFSGGFPGGDSDSESNERSDFSGGFPGGGGQGGFGMGSDASKLKYTDDDEDSYSAIFESAKTTVTTADKKRLISSLKTLSEGITSGDADTIAEAVNIDEVLRYMVVHNFVVNGDSYTGSMIHNFYLYEDDGLLSMIPWDYNLAFGTFQAQDSDGAVNDPIDNPLSITDGDTDRPMFSWIISNDEYTELYHEYYSEFLEQFYESGYLTDLIDKTYEMISEYVDKDPTKFCTTEEFETAVDTIRTFVELRCESISGQLDGTIGSTDAEQEENPDALVDASSINLSDMGSMGGGGGPGGGPGRNDSDSDSNSDSRSDSGFGDFPGGGPDSSSDSDTGNSSENNSGSNTEQGSPEDGQKMDFPQDFPGSSSASNEKYIYAGASILILLAGILVAATYKKRR